MSDRVLSYGSETAIRRLRWLVQDFHTEPFEENKQRWTKNWTQAVINNKVLSNSFGQNHGQQALNCCLPASVLGRFYHHHLGCSPALLARWRKLRNMRNEYDIPAYEAFFWGGGWPWN